MTSRYIPPHLRHKSKSATGDPALSTEIDDGQEWGRRRLADLKLTNSDKEPLYTLFEIKTHYGSSTTNSTLHDSAESPGQLSYVVLFRNANPKWDVDNLIFAHTNIELLPGYEMFKSALDASISTEEPRDEVPGKACEKVGNFADPPDSAEPLLVPEQVGRLPVFMEQNMPRGKHRRYVFHGYFSIANIKFLKPQSQELVQMLQEKWQPIQHNPNKPPFESKQRDQAAWKKSMSQEWAVIKMQSISRQAWPEEPHVELLPEDVHQDQGRAERKEKAFDKRLAYDTETL